MWCTWLFLSLLAWPPARSGAAEQPWVNHSSFRDFAAGTLGDGGSNLFVSSSGSIQMIHLWDLNYDGFLDLLVGQDHNVVENEDILVYWGGKQGPRSLLPPLQRLQPLGRLLREVGARERFATRLPSYGGGRSLLVDLNGDGFKEIVFCNYIHNYSVHMNALIYWGSREGYRADRRTELPTLLAGGLAAADFNRDGYTDLVFANRGIEGGERFGFDQHLESYIYWNGPTGFSAERRTSLPTISATDCAAGDLNSDGYPDILFLNNNSREKSFYLYWGSAEGFSPVRREVWRKGDPTGCTLIDLNKDGRLDLVVTQANNTAEVFRGTGKGFDKEAWVTLPTLEATQCRSGDLNKDDYPDLVFANPGTESRQASFIYWGSAQGYAADRRTELPTLHATDAALADFNGDGWIDVAFSNEHDGKTYDVNSYIYLNGPEGFRPAARIELQGFGAASAQAEDLDKDGNPDLVLVSRYSGSFAPVDSLIYWGNPGHFYSPAAMSAVPGPGNAVPTVADLDQNGYADIVFGNGWIYWGSPTGYDPANRQDLKCEKGQGTAVADLNKDGYLDLAITSGSAMTAASPSMGHVYWGGVSGLRPEKRTDLRLEAQISLGPTIADLNKDGFLDLVFPDVDSENLEIFWGGPGDYSKEKRTLLKAQSSDTVEVADLNSDGWLDLILGGGWDRKEFGRPTRQASILWGGPKGFSSDAVTKLPAFCALEQAVADLNKDGYLDIVMTNYHAYLTRTIPVFIYWGGPGGNYSDSRRTSLPAESSSALTVADLNRDGWLDIVAFNHLDRGDHGVGANLFWGGPDGYSYAKRDWIPTFGPHFGVRRDIGNIYDRRLQEEYISGPLRCPAGRSPSSLAWSARTPHGTAVKFQLRTGKSESELQKAVWQGPQGSQSYYERSGTALQPPAGDEWLQYKAVLTTPDGGSTPVLESVRINVK